MYMYKKKVKVKGEGEGMAEYPGIHECASVAILVDLDRGTPGNTGLLQCYWKVCFIHLICFVYLMKVTDQVLSRE